MSNALLVLCKEAPDLPQEGELDDTPVTFQVRRATPEEAERVAGQHKGIFEGTLDVAPTDMTWAVELDFPASVEFDSFHAGGLSIARHSGGGVLWSPIRNTVVDVAAKSPRPPLSASLLDEVEFAFEKQREKDEDDLA